MVKKNKFTAKEWRVLKVAIGGFRGELHHLAGKQYEYLNLLLPLSSEEHRGKDPIRNYKHPDDVPKEFIHKAMGIWSLWLTEDELIHFAEEGLMFHDQS